MANEVIVGVYDSRRDAEIARMRLLEQGVEERQITIEQGPARHPSPMSPGDRTARAIDEPLREDGGVAGFIGRMFSGALIGDANIAKYTEALRDGKCMIAVRTRTDAESNVASSILARSDVRVHALPDAPSGWNEASDGDPASIGGADRDPARPEGLLEDAEGLSVTADRARFPDLRRSR